MSTPVEQTFRDAMLADAAVVAIVAQRFYLHKFPQNAVFPCISYDRISTVKTYVHTLGAAQGSFGWVRFQATCYGGDGPNGTSISLSLADAVIAALQTFNAAAAPASPVVLRQAPNFLLNQRDGICEQLQQPIYTQVLDLKIWAQTLN